MNWFNSRQHNMTFDDVVENLITFIKKDPYSSYRLAVGTDSQVIGNKTCFALGIHLHRIGKGSYGCVARHIEKRRIKSLREKISMEVAFTQHLVSLFNDGIIDKMTDVLLPYVGKGANLEFEVHIDIGEYGATRTLIREMTSYFVGLGIPSDHIRIKPYSYAASSFANKYSKKAVGV